MRHLLLLALGLLTALASASPTTRLFPTDSPWWHRPWKAEWIAHPTAPGHEFGVFWFQHTVLVEVIPASCVIHVSADNRYRLFLNGLPLGRGPALSDLGHWRFETYDLGPLLRKGENTLVAQVWNGGEHRPIFQNSARTAFVVQGEAGFAEGFNTSSAWNSYQDFGYNPLPPEKGAFPPGTYFALGSAESVSEAKRAHFAMEPARPTEAWRKARALGQATPRGTGTGSPWLLVPNRLPPAEETPQPFAAVRRSDGPTPPEGFLSGLAAWSVPPHTRARLLLDQGTLTTAFPEIVVSGGQGARVNLRYAEALVDGALAKGPRDQIEGRQLIGWRDEYLPDGEMNRSYQPLWYRSFRFVEVEVETAESPLTVHSLRSFFTAYPFEKVGRFQSDRPDLDRIWSVGWHTARLCAYETYLDCPYYEQLQYLGDARIQGLISLYVAGDDRLLRNVIEQADHSRLPEGLTQSRMPSDQVQVIPPFSLYWVSMVHDYWRHRHDDAFIQARLPGISNVLSWFSERVDPQQGLLGPLPFWNFVDWTEAWPWNSSLQNGGVPPGVVEGGSSLLSLHFAATLVQAAELFEAYGRGEEAARFRQQARELNEAVRETCWDAQRGLFADTPAQNSFSPHTSVWAILSGAVEGQEAQDLIRRIQDDSTLTPPSVYFRFYLMQAAKKAGLGQHYAQGLGPWQAMLDQGLTTFAETPDPTRSDCHAWSASPTYDLLATVCGIEPGRPGFSTVRIEPRPGTLRFLEGRVAHPAGVIDLRYTHSEAGTEFVIHLPPGVSGELIWLGETIPLQEGGQTLRR